MLSVAVPSQYVQWHNGVCLYHLIRNLTLHRRHTIEMGAIRLSLVRMSLRISKGTDQMCFRHFHGYITQLLTKHEHPATIRGTLSTSQDRLSACCRSSISRSNLRNSTISTRLHRTVWPALAQIRTKLTYNWDTISIYIPFTIKPSAGSSQLRDGFLNSVFALDYSLRWPRCFTFSSCSSTAHVPYLLLPLPISLHPSFPPTSCSFLLHCLPCADPAKLSHQEVNKKSVCCLVNNV